MIFALVLFDSLLDLLFAQNKGLESMFWKPIADASGIKFAPLGVPMVLLIFFVATKILAVLVKKIDKTDFAEEILLTGLAVVYTAFDLWLVSVYFFGFTLFKSPVSLIPFLAGIGIIYCWWAQKKSMAG
ncbi:MAG: hypothetical protein HY394_04010 [Candidatus Diapherotrites archaeon]|nr:hypothetical protein [Candidatus Diapherotrites archaeon]